jgi:cation-transporting ATPase E
MASGSEAAAQSAKLVLLDSDFSCMPDVVYEGRRVVNNIERSATLFLVKNIFSFILSIFTMVVMVSYPLIFQLIWPL